MQETIVRKHKLAGAKTENANRGLVREEQC